MHIIIIQKEEQYILYKNVKYTIIEDDYVLNTIN